MLAAAILVPLVVIFGAWLAPTTEVWGHLTTTVLPTLIGNTLLLIVGVSVGTLILGVSLAWLVSTCEFPGRRWLDWALMLPFALPTYVMAFVFLGLLDFQGPVQGLARQVFDLPASWSVEVRNPASVLAIMVLVLYPYVYLLARVAFLKQGRAALEAAHTLGMTSWQSFFRVALPMARPAIIGGVSLAVMEALADFGAVAVFNYDTFTTAIYKAWFGFFDLNAASQLASLLLMFVFVLLYLERYGRSRARFDNGNRSPDSRTYRLRGLSAAAASTYCGLVLLLAFIIPMVQLLLWARRWIGDLDSVYLSLLGNTLTLGVMAAIATTAGGLVLAYALRRDMSWLTRTSVRIGLRHPGFGAGGGRDVVAVLG